ncbi:MAG TPA: hypothetical protein VFS75_02360 [Candidatus Paceibacterota bacterium]|nr:hypothetical protein [Candidatus Paceibacterota bacterium]
MAHPFEGLFEKALMRSHGDENAVLGQAERLLDEGYPPKEICDALRSVQRSLIAAADEAIIVEALEELGICDDE